MSEELDDSVFCPVCFECYSESGVAVPRLLPCTHTMCHACVDKLIKNSTLVCPQDRKAHPAPSGVLSFPQNKYVLKMLKLNMTTAVPPGGVQCDVCEEHGMEVVLYCKHPDCQTGICPLCMTAGHRDHSVVNIAEQRKIILKSRASVLMRQLGVDKRRLVATRQKLDQYRLELTQKLKQVQDGLEKDFEAKIKVIDENIKKLAKVCSDKNSDLTRDNQFIDTLQEQSEDKERMKYTFCDLTEIRREMEPPGEADIKHCERKQPITEVTRMLKLGVGTVTGIQLVSDGSLISYGHYADTGPFYVHRLCQHNLETERLIYSKEMIVQGAIEITFDGKPTLLLSDGTPTVKLFDTSDLAKWTGGSVTVKGDVNIGTLYVDPPHHVIRQDGRVLYRTETCLMSDPWTKLYCLQSDVTDMCFIRRKDTEDMIFFLACCKAVSARKNDGLLLWSFSGASTGMVSDIQPRGITVDQEKQKLYVCDEANRCIQIISMDGVYLGCLVKYYEYGLGRPELIRWYKQIQSLLIVHEKDGAKYLSVVKLNVD